METWGTIILNNFNLNSRLRAQHILLRVEALINGISFPYLIDFQKNWALLNLEKGTEPFVMGIVLGCLWIEACFYGRRN
jgi:hypothetical protein